MPKKPKRPKDTNELAKFIVDLATGERSDIPRPDGKNEGQRLGGLKGGKTRAEKLTDEQRKEIAKKAAKKRWG